MLVDHQLKSKWISQILVLHLVDRCFPSQIPPNCPESIMMVAGPSSPLFTWVFLPSLQVYVDLSYSAHYTVFTRIDLLHHSDIITFSKERNP